MDFNNAFFDELSRSPKVAALVSEITEEIADDLRASAPEVSGKYKNGISTAMKHQRRVVGLVLATDKKSLLVEAKLGLMVRALNRAKRRHRG